MGVRRYAGCVAVVLCAAVWPASALATINAISVQPGGALAEFLCIGSTTTSPISLRLATPNGSQLRSLTLATPDDIGGGTCPGSAHTFQPGARLPDRTLQPAFGGYPAGGRLTATQDGRSVSFTLPYGAFQGNTTRLRGLPDDAALTGGVVDPHVANDYDAGAAVQGGTVTVTGLVTDSAATTFPLIETITPRAYHVELENGVVRVFGDDPAGPPMFATLTPAGGSTLGRTALRPRVGDDCTFACSVSSTFDAPATWGGAVAVAGQPDWFGSRTVALPVLVLGGDGFAAALPAGVPGTTGSYDFDLRFFDPASISSLAATDPLRCRELGPAVSCAGGPPASRLAVDASGLFVVPGDTLSVSETSPAGDQATVTQVARGLSGSLDDGSLTLYGAPRALLQSSLRAPLPAPLAPFVAGHSDRTDAAGTAVLEDVFPVHIPNGAVATLTGPALWDGGTTPPSAVPAQTFQWNLAASISPDGVVSGTTYPSARVAVDHQQGGLTEHLETTASAAGSYAVTLTSPLPGDVVQVAAADPASRHVTETTTAVGALAPTISGVTDGQFVRGTITPTVAGAGLDSVLWNGLSAGGFPSLLSLTAPFPYALDTTRWPDGPHRLEVVGRPEPSGEDYRYVTIDNTPPSGGAGADQTVAKSRTATIVTGAGDATSGLAAVKVDFGDGHRLSLAQAKLGGPITHAYSKLGTFTVALAITDRAGNSTSDTARIRVASTVTPQIGGHFAGKLRRAHTLAASLLGRVPGQLQIFILSQTGARKLTRWVTFSKANQRIKVSLATKGLKLGRFVLVEQFTDANGIAGPVQAGALRVVKK